MEQSVKDLAHKLANISNEIDIEKELWDFVKATTFPFAKEAAVAWNVCHSVHRDYTKRKDPFYTTRTDDFERSSHKSTKDVQNLSKLIEKYCS